MKKQKTTSQKKKTGAYCRNKGHRYETKIAQELRNLGFTDVVTSRSESKSMDDKKVDLVDRSGKLPCYIQLKNTVNTPQYHAIKKECPLKDKPFIVIWNKQVKIEKVFGSAGEVVIMDKDFFYELLSKLING